MEDQTNNEVIEAVEKGLEKMENEGVLNGSDFTKPWRSSDVIFLVDEQFYVHRWVLAMWSPVFEKMFISNFSERKETEISFPNKASAEFKEILAMVYSCAESPVSVNTFFGTLHILWLLVVYTSKMFFHFLK